MTSATLGGIAAWMFPPSPKTFVQPEVSWNNGFGYQLSQPMQVLILGVEPPPELPEDSPERFSGRSDTILLLRFDPLDASVSLLSIPRDTLVEIPGIGFSKANTANYDGGIDLAKDTFENLLADVPIHRYVRIDTAALVELVDLLGGVEVFVPEAMSYTDIAGQLKIDLSSGWQILDGEQDEQFSRFRQGAYGDVGRVQRQQELMAAIRSRLTNPTVLPRLPEVIRVIQKYIDTDLSLPEMMALVNFGLQLDSQALKMVMLPGEFGDSYDYDTGYWIADNGGRDRIVEGYFGQSTGRRERPIRSRSRNSWESTAPSFRIAIQNTTTDATAVDRFQKELEQLGFEDTYVAPDWSDTQRQTQIIIQKGHLNGAKFLQESLGFGEIVTMSTGDLDSDLTIRIGEDWQLDR
ncbi:LCP family protein [Oscillatoriales cyanobacterium LEGE 11467]|uniref:LCP family protein n=1 Tax=Zarconia navalis LEGE 11467 TaxID=1828826 RepID=A0A928VYW9_9CYAN|nr:LCP family protein [Zarconia navalis]MBE9041372.1 LCP family protein [Zarconia navalis LEGE 11467]